MIKYPWLEQIWLQLSNNLKTNRLANVLLIESASNLGAKELVDNLVQLKMCTNKIENNAGISFCGKCHNCNLINYQTHPDLHLIIPNNDSKIISVEQIRHCNRLAQESSHLNNSRIFVISYAENLNEAAANAFLKTLEDSSPSCFFILRTCSISHVLITIRSRCQQWSIKEPKPQDSLNWIISKQTAFFSENNINLALKLNNGSPLRALSALENDELKLYEKLQNTLVHTLLALDANVVSCADLFTENPSLAIDWAWLLLTDAQKVLFGLDLPDVLDVALKFKPHHYNGLYKGAQSLLKLKADLKQAMGLNVKLLVINWLLNIREELCS